MLRPPQGPLLENIPVSSELYWVLKGLCCRTLVLMSMGAISCPGSRNDKPAARPGGPLAPFYTEINIPSVRFHTLRACFATASSSRGVPSATVMKICGWQNLKTMERYIRLAGIDGRGAAEGLGFIPSAQGVMEKVVSMYDFKANQSMG